MQPLQIVVLPALRRRSRPQDLKIRDSYIALELWAAVEPGSLSRLGVLVIVQVPYIHRMVYLEFEEYFN